MAVVSLTVPGVLAQVVVAHVSEGTVFHVAAEQTLLSEGLGVFARVHSPSKQFHEQMS